MEPFECSGVWWTPDAPSSRIAGILRFSHEDGLVLSLLGTLGGVGRVVGEKGYPIILGSAYDSPLGESVTLRECQQSGYTMRSSGFNNESYRVHLGFFGAHLVSPEDFRFSDCDLGISGLSAWAAHLTGFHFEHDNLDKTEPWTFRLTYTPPPDLRAEIP